MFLFVLRGMFMVLMYFLYFDIIFCMCDVMSFLFFEEWLSVFIIEYGVKGFIILILSFFFFDIVMMLEKCSVIGFFDDVFIDVFFFFVFIDDKCSNCLYLVFDDV